ncbi:hypothetical protein F0562_009487 [Nyssa sinensis]|uniref:RING-type E3 ubiquitin transferase n=1 Tax=Nyssa sinensis TaxID=561372 RepID=A0A5J4ZYT7_9ASTE|nr:hypothetical protein F0562_009487 [Nyssa sinensis]
MPTSNQFVDSWHSVNQYGYKHTHQSPIVQNDQIMLVLWYPKTKGLITRGISGELQSLNQKWNLTYFDSVHISSQLGHYSEYQFGSEELLSKACNPYPYKDNMLDEEIKMFIGDGLCEKLQDLQLNDVFNFVPNCGKLGPFVLDRNFDDLDNYRLILKDLKFNGSQTVAQPENYRYGSRNVKKLLKLWGGLVNYAGIIQDFFLLPQIVGNALWKINGKPLRKSYYLGFTMLMTKMPLSFVWQSMEHGNMSGLSSSTPPCMASLPVSSTTPNLHTPRIRTIKDAKSIQFTPTQLTKLQENDKNHRILYKSYVKHISSLCKDAQIQEAVDLITEMESKNLQIGPEVYGELLQGCVYERDLFTGQQIHAKIIKNGEFFTTNEYIETKLVIFYAKCDFSEIATRLFCRLRRQNVFSWAAIIGLNCRIGLSEEALLGFCEMQENGFLPDNFVIPNALKACGALQLIGFGKGVHSYVLKMEFKGCVFVASSLVDMYGKCGFLVDARKVFDDMVERNVVAWNSMIVSYVQNGMNKEAIEVFCDMRVEGVGPTRVTLASFLSASANLNALPEGKQGHAISILSGLDLDNILGSSIINLYSKVGLIEEAELVFSRILERDVVTWNLLISCYVQHGLVENALNLCRLMRLENFRFDSVTLASILSASADTSNIKLGKECHSYCIRNNLESDVVVSSSIIDMYAKCKIINDARQVFNSTTQRDLVLCNTLLAAYAELGLIGDALKLFYQMQLESIPPNVISWNSVILGFLRNGQVNEAKDMFSQMQSLGFQPNLITWTTLICGLAQNGLGSESVMFFQQMLEAGIQPNIVSIIGVLSACTNITSLQFGRAIHGYIMRQELHFSVSVATSLVDMYAKCGSLDQAKRVFDMILSKELPLYNVMISSYALHGQAIEVLALLKQLQKEGIVPDNITFTSILTACSHAGLVNEGLEFFVDMVSEHHVKPTMEHYGCVVSLLSRHGNLDEALMIILTMPFEPDAHILGSLLAACREHHKVELGEYLSKYLFELEPDNSGNYVALSNAYAAAGKWNEVSRLRILMKEKGLKKSPGCSWIQIGGEFHVFVAGDISHPDTEEIYSTLALLSQEMQFLGYVQ